MAELLAENFHNTWAKKKKMEMEAKGESNFISHSLTSCPTDFESFSNAESSEKVGGMYYPHGMRYSV